MTRRSLTLLVAAALVAIGPSWGAGGSSKPEKPAATTTPEQTATEHYNRGIDQRDRAWAFEGQAQAVDDEQKKAKFLKRAQNAYENAIEELRRAVAAAPRMHEAWGSLGYAYRQTGKYAEALASYDRALSLDPDYAEAIEYRAEAYLGLGRIDEAKEAHTVLAAKDAARAAQLLEAMRAWIDQQRSEGGGGADVASLESWVDVRAADRAYEPQAPRKARTW